MDEKTNFMVAMHRYEHGVIAVIADMDLIGEVFIEGGRELCINGPFFSGEEMGEQEVIGLLKSARHLHLTGKKIVEIALNMELICAENILWVAGVPHAQAVN